MDKEKEMYELDKNTEHKNNDKFPMSKHDPSVQHALKVAEKHGEDVAKKKGHDWDGSSIDGVKVTKKDFMSGDKVNT